MALKAGASGETVADLGGQVVEGWRASGTPGVAAFDPRAASTPVYRQSNIGRLQLNLSPEHWEPPRLAERWCVRPGDVVLNKLAPVRAALVSPAARRHPVDGNSIIVRGLPRAVATWLAVCLNRSEYEHLLLIESGVLRRVGLGMLAGLRLPPVPEHMEALSSALRDLLDETLLVGESVHRAKVEAAKDAWLPGTGPSLRSGVFFDPEAVSHESWLPGSVALRSEQVALAEDRGWLPLRQLAHADDRTRIQMPPEGARALKLGDVGEDLFVAAEASSVEAAALQPGRMLSKPLIPGEVLVSTLAASSRAAYVDDSVPPHTYPTDSWVRLRFRETPAAWALLLSAPSVRRQMAGLAVGSVQQFVPPESLLSVHVPTPERETRDRWQRTVERHHAQRRELDRRWADMRVSLQRAFEEAHGLPEPRPTGLFRRSEVRQ